MNVILDRLLNKQHLSGPEASDLLVSLTTDTPPALAGALLAALRAKGETPAEVRGFATAMRRLAKRPLLDDTNPAVPFVDLVGTGGDNSGSLNLSTGSALLAAACGLRVVKHGNRSVSSKSGSADVLEALGLPLPLDEHAAGACLRGIGFTFLFAPHYHPAMASIAPVRRALGVRTIFNILGPLTNPAAPPYAVIGACNEETASLMAHALAEMPIARAFVIHGASGWDEPTPIGPFLLFDVAPGTVRREHRDPADYTLPLCGPEDLMGGDARANAAAIRAVFHGERTPHRDALTLGAALALQVTGTVEDPADAARTAQTAIDTGAAAVLLERIAAFTPSVTDRAHA